MNKMNGTRFRKIMRPEVAGLLLAMAASAQYPTTPPATTQTPVQPQTKPRTIIRRPATGPSRVVVAAQTPPASPQVVTVVHQLSGIKMLRMMLRQRGEQQVVAMMSAPLAMTSEVHTNIIAGLILDDGQTIAVWLPQAAAEIERPLGVVAPGWPMAEQRASVTTVSTPSLSVVLSDGKRLRASYVGLDGTTGVSVLHANVGRAPSEREVSGEFTAGQRVRLLAPQRADVPAVIAPGTIYVRLGETQGKLDRIMRTSTGKLERLTANAANLSAAFVGGIALDESGATIGIIERIEGDQALILPVSIVESAVHRVLERHASVPRPWLGVRGEPVELTSRAFFLSHGWPEPEVGKLFEKPSGILLTQVLPGTPAALANLQPGDVIVRVNETEVRSEDDFSKLLSDAGSGTAVNFTLLRPRRPAPESIVVKLGGSLEPFLDLQYFMFSRVSPAAEGPLTSLGIETFALSSRVASAFGARGGLLVVGVQPESAGARVGVREGDLIETIDGRPATRNGPFLQPRDQRHTLTVIREQQRLEISVELTIEKQP